MGQGKSQGQQGQGQGLRRIEARFRGHVQGVGFRFNACNIAKGMQVFGFVRNEIDGSVLLIAEGRSSELEQLVNEIETSRLGPNIKETTVAWQEATGSFESFVIQR